MLRTFRTVTVTVTFNANSRIWGYRQSLSKIDKPCLKMVHKLCLHFSAAARLSERDAAATAVVAPVTVHLVPAFGAHASLHHPTSLACPNFCAAGTTGRWSCMQSATVGKDSPELPFAVYGMPTVRNRCACFLNDVFSCMCLPAGLIHGKEGCALQLFKPSALWSTTNSWCQREKKTLLVTFVNANIMF